ncbi:MAG TPA: ATP-binding cassette domain-containing protein [Acidimicrobiia bacterium]|nr:ATP-binding cassette domain-containing protein [Acidimicrobiia bacterium]
MSSDPTVSVLGVGLDAGGCTILDDVGFEAVAGEFVGIIGPNGAGKSTLLSVLGGSLRAVRGKVALMGKSVRDMTPLEQAMVRSYLGASPPTDVPFPVRSVVEAGRFPFTGIDHGNDETNEEEMVEAAMSRAEVGHLAGRIYSTLSSGEQARVLIARVLAQASPIALLDEPTAALDLANAERALAVLSRAEDATTVLCVLHDLNAAAYFCDRLLLLGEGRLVASGPPAAVLQSDVLSETYRQRLRVIEHPFRSCPLVLAE